MKERMVRLIVQAVVSLSLLAGGLYVLISVDLNQNPELVAAASGWIGLVIGFWLR